MIVGLGNPGAEYERTRHNAGFWLVEAVAAQQRKTFKSESKFNAQSCQVNLNGQAVWLLKPQSFMNRSGLCVAAFAKYYKLDIGGILVAHDELDLEPGVVRLKRGGGHGGHNGLRDVVAHIGGDFARLRVGIGHPGSADQVVDYVLHAPGANDFEAITAAITRVLAEMPRIVSGEIDQVMNVLNRK